MQPAALHHGRWSCSTRCTGFLCAVFCLGKCARVSHVGTCTYNKYHYVHAAEIHHRGRCARVPRRDFYVIIILNRALLDWAEPRCQSVYFLP
jgi:hypothetical protein